MESTTRNVANKKFWDKNQGKLIRINNFDNKTEKIADTAKSNYDLLTSKTEQKQIITHQAEAQLHN